MILPNIGGRLTYSQTQPSGPRDRVVHGPIMQSVRLVSRGAPRVNGLCGR